MEIVPAIDSANGAPVANGTFTCGVGEAAKAKADFLSNMSHELRTPLNGLLGMVEVLRETGLEQEQREFLDAIKQCGQDMLRIVNNLLDISQARRGELSLKPGVFHLRAALETIAKPKQEAARQKGLEFSLKVNPELPDLLLGDEGRLQQVVLNLVENAIKFTTKGKIEVLIDPWESCANELGQVWQTQKGNGQNKCLCTLHVVVKDTGIGIPPEEQKEIFEAFHLAEDLLTKKYAGAGLGLPISEYLAQMMGGGIWFQSTPDEGSVFHFTACFQEPPPQGNPGDVAPAEVENLRVLLVEDDRISRFLAKTILSRLGHKVTSATNSSQALSQLTSQRFDLVLMDIQLPDLDGLCTATIIRDPQSNILDHDVPIVALSVFSMQIDKKRFMDAGMDGYLTKPVEKDRLQRAMAKALHKRRSGDAFS